MRVLLVVNSDIGRKNTIGFRFGKIVQELQNKNINFSILARANYSDLFVKTPFYKNYLARFFNAIRIYLLPFLNFRKLDVWLFDRFVLKNIKKDDCFDLAHFGEYLPKSIKYLKEKNIKIFLDIPIGHHKYAQYLQGRGFRMDEEIGEAPICLDGSLALADVIIAPSEFVKKTLEMAGFVHKKISIIPFGADTVKNFEDENIIKRLEEKPIKFIFSGAVNYRKGINFLLEAWDKLKLEDAELLICGRVYKSIRKEIKKYKNNNVKFLGFVDVKEYLKKSHVFVFPTLLEGSAKAVYEAMSYGLPIITTENAGSIVENGQSGFIVDVGNVDSLVEKIAYFYNNPEKITEMGIKALGASKQYTWENYGQNIVNLYLK
jgi:glycosyltransferase involved in cell wall biosynthesis